ncbi:MAG TPA: hypothetical protein ENK57_03995 [Polyangiaceae bacterium]|nr:hypothetical protein [Polyangiaceae bacterium]
MSRALRGVALAVALWGCSTDCDDAAGKLTFCELPVVSSLEGECDDEGPLACQARCVRDTSCDQLTRSMAGEETDFDRCERACGAPDLFAGLKDDLGAGGGGGAGSGGAGGQAIAEQ